MDLTVDVFLDYLKQARTIDRSQGHARCKSPRISMAVAVQFMPTEGPGRGHLMDATLLNASARGVGIRTAAELVQGQQFCLRLFTSDGRSRWVQCIAARDEAASGNDTIIGARFCKLTCTEIGEQPVLMLEPMLVDIIPNRSRVVPMERPRTGTARMPEDGAGNANIEINAALIDSVRKDKIIRVVIRRLTRQDMTFTCRGPLAEGTRMTFDFKFSGTTKRVFAQVMRCTQLHMHECMVVASMTLALAV